MKPHIRIRTTALIAAFIMTAGIQPLKAQAAEPAGIAIFRNAYPDVVFNCTYDHAKSDWRIEMTVPFESGSKTSVLYWADGSLLPENELTDKSKYWSLLYPYSDKLADPADFTQEDIERMRNFGSDESRRSKAGTPMFFFDVLYDTSSKKTAEEHMVSVMFLNKAVRVHERLKAPLSRVETQVFALAETDKTVKSFLDEIKQADGYYWREISGTNRKSFHSLGIAVDILPKNLHGKAIYWSWTKDINPDNWMLTPLKDRWAPPSSVIDIFEKEGFIWGGKWGIWDNMHFEYHPEIILYSAGQRQ